MEKGSIEKKQKDFEEQIQNFECPFTWQMDCIKASINVDYHAHDDEELLPVLRLMRIIMKIYIETRENMSNKHQLLEQLGDCDEIMIDLKNSEDPEISYVAVRHILLATRCFVLLHLGLEDKLELVLEEMKDATSITSKRDKSTLLGCRAIGWSKYHRVSTHEAQNYIRKAIEENSNCHLWYFILGKNLRRIRRDNNYFSKPKCEEIESFEKAYDMSQNPVYGIFLAQMYREQKWFSKAIEMYNRVCDTNPESKTILLRIALGFIRLNQCDKAKLCLDQVAKENSSESMYLHYMGIYYIKIKDTQKAIGYLKAASKDNNLPAELQYIEIMVKSDPRFDITNYLLCMLDKYSNLPQKSIQCVILDLAFSYWFKKGNLTKSVEYFLKAIEVDPKAQCIEKFYSSVGSVNKGSNVFHWLKKQFLPRVHRASNIDEVTIEKIDKIEKYCDEHEEDTINATQKALLRMNFY